MSFPNSTGLALTFEVAIGSVAPAKFVSIPSRCEGGKFALRELDPAILNG